jgi:hypothetical protein
MNGDLKTTFIQKSLAEYMLMVANSMRAMAIKKKVGVTNDAINSIAYKTLQQGGGAMAQLSFKEYLRFVDMGVGRAHPLGGLTAMKVSLQSKQHEALALVKDKARKPKTIYSKSAYGKLGWLNNKLLYGFTEETIALLKTELENGTTSNNN